MTKTEYTAAITTTQTAIFAIRTDLRKLRNIEKLAGTFTDLKLVDTDTLTATITTKKAELTKLRAELSKARRIVKRMGEIEDIEAGKTPEKKAKKSTGARREKAEAPAKTTEKKPTTKKPAAKKPTAKPEAKADQTTSGAEVKENPAA